MSEYTYKDVIIDPEDPRVEIGKEYYFAVTPSICISKANSNGRYARLYDIDVEEDYPFKTENCGRTACIIRKKEPKYVPFDLSKEEDRAKLRGAWIKYQSAPGYEYQITGVETDRLFVYGDEHTPESLLEKCLFIDGTPCGKLEVMEE